MLKIGHQGECLADHPDDLNFITLVLILRDVLTENQQGPLILATFQKSLNRRRVYLRKFEHSPQSFRDI